MFGVGIGHEISFRDIEITNLKTGKPLVNMYGKGKEFVLRLKIKTIHISISHDKNYAETQGEKYPARSI